MKIVSQSAQILWITPNAIEMIERSGRTAYKSEDKITSGSAEKFVRMILDRGHDSVIEHASASMLMVTDRGVSHELVRHRLFSYTQESTRYCNYGKGQFGGEITVIKPPGMDYKQEQNWADAINEACVRYLSMISQGAAPQIARSVLPNSLKTEIVVTGNFRQWRHFFKMRTSKSAHPQMQELANTALGLLRWHVPVIFESIS